jgi:hypothetical protein
MTEDTAAKPKRIRKPKADALLHRKPALPEDPLDAVIAKAEAGDLTDVIALLLWKQRHENPNFTLELHPRDINGLKACVEYLEVTPTVRVFRPGGVEATPERVHPRDPNKIIPGRPAIPPKPYIIVQMTDEKGDAFVPIENNEQDFAKQQDAQKLQRMKDQAVTIARALQGDLTSGQFSTSTIADAINCLSALAGSR